MPLTAVFADTLPVPVSSTYTLPSWLTADTTPVPGGVLTRVVPPVFCRHLRWPFARFRA